MKEININGIEYVKFKEENGSISYVAKTILSKEVIDDIVEDKRYLDSEKDVRYNNDIFDNSWENSFIRKILNSTFKEKYLKDVELASEVRCLTKEEAENLPSELKETEGYGYWTMSPYNLAANGYASVFRVNSYGTLYGDYVSNTYGVRPVIMLKTDKLNNFENQGVDFQTDGMIEKINIVGENNQNFIEFDDKKGHHKYTLSSANVYFANKLNEIIDVINNSGR